METWAAVLPCARQIWPAMLRPGEMPPGKLRVKADALSHRGDHLGGDGRTKAEATGKSRHFRCRQFFRKLSEIDDGFHHRGSDGRLGFCANEPADQDE